MDAICRQHGCSIESLDLHAIGDCNAYLARKGDKLVLAIEHCAARSPDPMILDLLVDDASGAMSLCVRSTTEQNSGNDELSLEDRVIDALRQVDAPMLQRLIGFVTEAQPLPR